MKFLHDSIIHTTEYLLQTDLVLNINNGFHFTQLSLFLGILKKQQQKTTQLQ